ncbi:GTP-binding protein Rho3 [Rhodotorula toruloides]|nr:GTP-binding protein Rho3 [Rhodotorula toruloides]
MPMPALCGLPLPGSSGAHDHAGNGYGLSGTSTKDGRPVVVVGDGACGKTSLLNVYVKGEFPELYEPTVFENHCVDIVVDGTPIELALWDTAGQEDFDRLRSLSYADSNVVLLCFSVDQPTSLENIESKWVDEIRHYCPGVKLALVALKCDLRSDPVVRDKLASAGLQPVEYEENAPPSTTEVYRRRLRRPPASLSLHDEPGRLEEARLDMREAAAAAATRYPSFSRYAIHLTQDNPRAMAFDPHRAHADPHAYPPVTSPYSHDHDAGMAAPRPFRQGSSANSSTNSIDEQTGQLPYVNYGSQPSLPRYQSHAGSATSLANPSPLNPAATRSSAQGYSPNPPNVRYSAYGGYQGQQGAPGQGAHPLSNAMYMESSPTLAGSDMMSPNVEKHQDEKMRLGAGDQLGEYIAPTTSSSSGNSAPYRRGPKPTGLKALYRVWSGANLADSGKDDRHVKLPHLGYLDGMKFIAAWVVLNGTYFAATISDNDYTAIQRSSPLYIVRSTNLGWTFLLVLMGRSLITPLWDVPSPSAPAAAGAQPKSALISWARLTRAMLVRPFRFILPVLAVVAVQWGVAANGDTANCNNVGMDEPYWRLVSNFAGYCTLVFDLFTTYETSTIAGQTFAGNLWTNPWFFQASYAVYVIHLMLGNLSSNRYWVYALIGFFSWTTYNYIFAALLGLVIADMHAHGHLHKIRTKWPAWQRLSLHAVLIAIALVFQWVPVIRDNVNSGLAKINVTDHPELTFCDAIFAACWLFCIETSGIAQTVFGNIVMRNLGKLSAGMVLLAPVITYTLVPDIALNMHNNGSSASSVLGVCWVAMFGIVFALAIAFHFAVELPSKMMGEVFAELMENWNGEGFRKGGNVVKKAGGAAKLSKK